MSWSADNAPRLAERGRVPGAKNMTGSRPSRQPAQNQSIGPSVSLGNSRVESHSQADHALLLPPFRQQRGTLPDPQRDAAHDAEAVG